MRKALLFLLLIFVAEWARSEDWTTTDKALATVTAASIITDWRQTQGIVRNCHTVKTIHEINPILGECPSMARVYSNLSCGFYMGWTNSNTIDAYYHDYRVYKYDSINHTVMVNALKPVPTVSYYGGGT